MLRIGQIEYANCTPLYHLLKDQFICDDYQFVTGVPADLNRLLASGEIDVCPSSSIEYALNANRYLILPHLSISSEGAVASVLLFSHVPIEDLDGETILLSSESATSVNLLKILMKQHYVCSCSYTVTRLPLTEALAGSTALLLIGDAALKASMMETDIHIYDLGEIWHRWTGLPFVFALWLCRCEVAESHELVTLARQLVTAKESAASHYRQIAEKTPASGWMGVERLLSYWQSNISYELASPQRTGLTVFFEKCHQAGLISSVPQLQFVTT